jgi:hypothetical protein
LHHRHVEPYHVEESYEYDVYKHSLVIARSTTKHAQYNSMSFSKAFSADKSATTTTTTTTTVAQALEPTVAAIHPKEDGIAEALKSFNSYGSTPSELSLDEANPFSDPKVAAYYREIYESSQYECRGAFDPDLEWTPAEEKRIVRKLDWRVTSFACFAFFALQCDRGNLAQVGRFTESSILSNAKWMSGSFGQSTERSRLGHK